MCGNYYGTGDKMKLNKTQRNQIQYFFGINYVGLYNQFCNDK